MATAQKLIEIASAEVGNGPDKYNTGGQPWCAIFVNWCLKEAGYEKLGDARASSFADFGTIHNNDGYTPKPGDLLLVDYKASQPWASHVAIVKSSTDNKLLTINGNSGGNKVTESSRSYNSTITIIEMTWDDAGNRSLPKIFLNPGHGTYVNGTYDSGAVGHGYEEAKLTREVVSGVESALAGYAEVTVWDNDKDLFDYLRQGQISIDWSQYAYCLSIHFNANGGSAAGTEVYHHPGREDCKTDNLLLSKVAAAGGFDSRGIIKASHLVTSTSDKCANGGSSSSLLELCYIDNAEDIKKYQAKKSEIAKAIARALIEGLGLVYSNGGSWSAPWVKKELPNNARALKSKTYERYWKIKNQATDNYKISCGDKASTHTSKLRVYRDSFLIIALGSYYGPVGTYVKIALDNGVELVCIKGDEKDDRETNTDPPAHSYHVAGPGYVENNQISVNLLEVQADTESSGWQQEFAQALDQYAGGGTYDAGITGIWISDTEPKWQAGSGSGDKQTYFSNTNEVIPLHPTIFGLADIVIDGEMAVYINDRDVTASVGPISWTNTHKELATSISIDAAKSDAKFTHLYQPQKGDILRLFLPNEVFRGVIIADDTGDRHSSKYTAADVGWYMSKSKDTYQFNASSALQCIEKICGDLGIPIAYIDSDALATSTVTGVYTDKAVAEVIWDVLEQAGGAWNFDFVPKGIRIYKVGAFLADPQYRASPNTMLRSAIKYRGPEDVSSSIEDMCTAVKVISDTHVLTKTRSESNYQKYGFLQEVIQIDPEKEDANGVAAAKLAELNVEKSTRGFAMPVQLCDYTRAGDVVQVDGVRYMVESADHEIAKARHIVKLGLERIEIV